MAGQVERRAEGLCVEQRNEARAKRGAECIKIEFLEIIGISIKSQLILYINTLFMKFTVIVCVLAFVAIVNAGDCRGDIAIGGAICSRDFDCGNNYDYGKCRNDTCVCAKGYFNADCSYPAKKALVAGLLGIPLMVGMCGLPSLYVGIYKWGIPQLLIGVIPFIGAIIGSVFLCHGRTGSAVRGITIACVVVGFLAWGASWVWTLADAIQFGTLANGYTCDGNGYPLYKE